MKEIAIFSFLKHQELVLILKWIKAKILKITFSLASNLQEKGKILQRIKPVLTKKLKLNIHTLNYMSLPSPISQKQAVAFPINYQMINLLLSSTAMILLSPQRNKIGCAHLQEVF